MTVPRETTRNAASLREALHAAIEMADLVCEVQSLVAPMQVGKQVAVQVPIAEWGDLCTAIREVLDHAHYISAAAVDQDA